MDKHRITNERNLDSMFLHSSNDVLGIAVKMLGVDRIMVKCQDGKEHLCRVRGKLKRYTWIREGDIVLVASWIFRWKQRATYFGGTERTSLTGLEAIITYDVDGRLKLDTKSTECENTFRKDGIAPGEGIICPNCEAQYNVAVASDGKRYLADFILDGNDPVHPN